MKFLTKYFKWTAAAVAMTVVVSMTSCDDQPDEFKPTGGVPTISYIRPTLPEQADSLLTSATLESLICIVGDNLKSVHEIWFNDQKATLNTSYMTDHTIIVNVPSGIPGEVSNKIFFKTASDQVVEFPFNVVVPGPRLDEMSLEWSNPGEEVTIYGDFFVDDPNVPLTIIMPGDIAVPAENIKSIEKNNVTFVIPDAATEAGPIEVTTIYGDAKSGFHYRDSRGLLFEFDGVTGLIDQGWHAREIKEDEWSLSGKYVQLGNGTAIMSEDGGWDDSNFAFEYWCGSWDTPQNVTSGQGMALHNLVNFKDFANMSLKFEMCIPSSNPWSAGAMQICFEGYDKVTLSGNPIDGYDGTVMGANAKVFNGEDGMGTWGRALYRPWAKTGSFHTDDKWITVTIPVSSFMYDREGNATNTVPSKPGDFASLTMFVVGGGINGTECQPIIKIDNIRAVLN
ncbi:MAG TPA: glycan-binding surface protein [Muribaculum sp.]|jgi:hypothetical protein|uniref:glycan-binding surface protein n=1 Tax=Heminiphilus faecis TaxID=2601703 RepID=UPI000EF5C701|nr:glycan-binding surface protein [Heminiphilus faecis]RLT75877.1 hypothetical protein D7V95_11475 [bacterium J10(2018)]HRF69101.1 glycan-binding surface protein [Muribaculum sp.]